MLSFAMWIKTSILAVRMGRSAKELSGIFPLLTAFRASPMRSMPNQWGLKASISGNDGPTTNTYMNGTLSTGELKSTI